MKMNYKLVTFLLLLPFCAPAKIRLPDLVAEHMVLQRSAKIPVWGWAAPR